jgi:hypothetical protein
LLESGPGIQGLFIGETARKEVIAETKNATGRDFWGVHVEEAIAHE